MKPKTYLLPSAAVIALLFTSCEKPAPESSAEVPGQTSPVSAESHTQKTCPVSGEELGSMGDPVIVDLEGTIVELCCKSCIKKFNADPEKYIAMVKEAKAE